MYQIIFANFHQINFCKCQGCPKNLKVDTLLPSKCIFNSLTAQSFPIKHSPGQSYSVGFLHNPMQPNTIQDNPAQSYTQSSTNPHNPTQSKTIPHNLTHIPRQTSLPAQSEQMSMSQGKQEYLPGSFHLLKYRLRD